MGTAITVTTFIVGTACLIAAFGWPIGCGVGLLVWFHKAPEQD